MSVSTPSQTPIQTTQITPTQTTQNTPTQTPVPYVQSGFHCLVPSMNNIAQERLFVSSNVDSWQVISPSSKEEFYNVDYICKQQKLRNRRIQCDCPPLSVAKESFEKAFFETVLLSKDEFIDNYSV
jgi:hypothetical protein